MRAKDQKEKEELDESWKKEPAILSEQEDELRNLGANVLFMANRLSRYEAVEHGDTRANINLAAASDSRRKLKKKIGVKKCSAEFCIVTQHDVNITWIDCSSCEKRYHSMCEGRTPIEEATADDEYNCTDCKGHEKVSDVINRNIEAFLNEEDALNDIIVESRKKCDDLKAAYVNHVGPYEQALLNALDSLNVVRQAYHGNVMVGNHCHKVLEGFTTLTNVLPHEDDRARFNTVFRVFDSIMELVLAKRFLSANEIDLLAQRCNEFGVVFPKNLPERNITPKVHMIVFDVPEFVRAHKTIGVVSEQEGESKHAAINAEIRPLACVRNAAEKLLLVFRRDELRSLVLKKILKKEARLCQRCHAKGCRSFLRAGSDGQRHCKECDNHMF